MTEQQIQALSVETEETETELTAETVVAELVEALKDESTAYNVAVLINKSFEILGVEKKIPTQMMYNYTKNGMIAKGKKGTASNIRYTKDEVKTFALKYINKYL
jgi:hypothetical protein